MSETSVVKDESGAAQRSELQPVVMCQSFQDWWLANGTCNLDEMRYAYGAWMYQQNKIDETADKHYRNGFNAGWNAGLAEDDQRLAAVQNRAVT